MSIQGKKELVVAALQNGIVIDHIPCDSLFKVVNILGIQNMENGVTIGNNLSCRSMGIYLFSGLRRQVSPENVFS